MKCRKLGLLFLILFSILLTINAVSAMPTVFLPPNKTLAIPDGVKLHLGNYYVQSVGTAIHIQKWLSSNWINYTVDGAGTQNIYYSVEPEAVYIDGSHHGEGDGWTYISNVISVTVAVSQVQINFATSTTPPDAPQTSSSQTVLFKVTLDGKPVENCEIRISTTTYQDYVATYMTDADGKATVYLAVGTYDYRATYQQKVVSGTFQHIQEETITLDLGTGEITQIPPLDKTQILKIGIGLLVVVGAVFAIVTVTKKRR